ncbi:CTP synthase, partial [Listeria monocytogenes]|nr:CTP synthase [Listeria monocytogenes]
PEQKNIENMGGTLRLGLYPARIKQGTKAEAAYGTTLVEERHRHRYEFNNEYREQMEEAGMIVSATSPDGRLVEVVELIDHPWFVACQYHPEFISRPNRPQSLFKDFVGAALKNK